MKKLVLFLTIACSVLCVNAAPPLRGLIPMKLSDGKMVAPLAEAVTPFCDDIQCASSAMIGESLYLQHSGSPRVLTILAAFQDVGFTVNDPVKAFDQYLNADKQENLGNMNQLNSASVRQYFETCSHKKFSPQFDVVGPITLPQKMAYYGGKNKTGSDDKFSDFCRDAMELANDVVSDWSIYDNDKDGRVELVCVIFAGYGQNQGGADSTIWAKASYQNIKLNDALRISRFNCCSELFNPSKGVSSNGKPYDYSKFINGTGVFIHEFSHCMGLPDLYATRSSGYVNNQGMESFSIMDYGLYNYNSFCPCPYTAWEQEVMGWTEMEDVRSMMVDDSCQIADMTPLIEGGKAYKLVNSNNDCDFIVMENVQKRGLNQYGEAHGLMVYHVDYPYTTVNMTDSPNNNPGHPSVAVVPAGGRLINCYLRGDGKTYTRQEWQESLQSATFPGSKNVTSLTDQMQLPNYCFWDSSKAKDVGFMLSNITENSEFGTVSFKIASNDATGINVIRSKMADVRGDVYNLAGQRVVQPAKGLYIVNGRKVVVR